ncbi:MAG TPA: DNA polymerase I [Planctomycetota bacterium]|jgi:DNA polymerase-1
MAPLAQTLYLIDSHAQLYRAYHALPAGRMLAADHKTPTNAVYGFAQILRQLRNRFKPDHLAAVFDPHGPVLREKLYDQYRDKLGAAFSGYKSHRDAMPDDLRPQIDLALELCQAYGIPTLQIEGYEADDVLGTMALQGVAKGLDVVVVSGDKDLLQLVGGRIKVYDPMKDISYDEDTVFELKGVKPGQVVDWLGFRGDSSDNIPGVTGVGDQTAVKLLQEHGSMDAALEHFQTKFASRSKEILDFVAAHQAECDKPKEQRKPIKPPSGVKVVEAYLFAQKESAIASRELARLTLNLPLELDLEKLHCSPPDPQKLVPLFKRLDFNTFLKDFDAAQVARAEAASKPSAEPASLFGDTEADASAKTSYVIIDSQKKLEEFCKKLKKQKCYALDTETTSTDPRACSLVGISISWQAGEAYYLPVRGPDAELLDQNALIGCLRESLEDASQGKIGHHIKFDMQVLRKCGVHLRGVVFDTMIAGWLLDPGALRLNLEELSFKYLNIRKTLTSALIGKGKQQTTMDMVPVADVAQYACADADCTWQLAQKFMPKLKEAGLEPLMRDIEVPLIDVLAEMEWSGIFVDKQLLQSMSANLDAQLAAQENDIYALAGEKFNINSTAQLGVILFEKLGLCSKGKTATGRDSTSEEVLTQLAKEHDLPRMILEYRGILKLKNTYVDQLPTMISTETGRIHASFHQTGTETGRLSSSDPNLQNIPIRSELGRSIRAAFKPLEPDWKILAADYSQIELRILAHYSRDKALQEAFEQGKDIHTAVAAQINGVTEEQVTREQRSRAKAVNFGIIYGQTAFGLSGVLGISRNEAQKIIDAYFAKHPKVRECKDEIIKNALEKGYVTTILGRRREIPQLRASDHAARALGERLAVNTVFQGSAADLIKKAMIEIHEELREGWASRMILQIHDELLFEVAPGEEKKLAKMVREKMEGALKLSVPLVVDVGVGEDWLSAKD